MEAKQLDIGVRDLLNRKEWPNEIDWRLDMVEGRGQRLWLVLGRVACIMPDGSDWISTQDARALMPAPDSSFLKFVLEPFAGWKGCGWDRARSVPITSWEAAWMMVKDEIQPHHMLKARALVRPPMTVVVNGIDQRPEAEFCGVHLEEFKLCGNPQTLNILHENRREPVVTDNSWRSRLLRPTPAA